jgi:hypothetical protein
MNEDGANGGGEPADLSWRADGKGKPRRSLDLPAFLSREPIAERGLTGRRGKSRHWYTPARCRGPSTSDMLFPPQGSILRLHVGVAPAVQDEASAAAGADEFSGAPRPPGAHTLVEALSRSPTGRTPLTNFSPRPKPAVVDPPGSQSRSLDQSAKVQIDSAVAVCDKTCQSSAHWW